MGEATQANSSWREIIMNRINIVRRTTLGLLIAGFWCMGGLAIGQSFTAIDYPGASQTLATGINKGGDIVGTYVAAGVTHGFLLSAGKFTSIDYPGATSTSPNGINSQDDVVGGYNDTGGGHGFLLSKGKFTSLDYPGAGTGPLAITSAGDIVGMLTPPGKPMEGFLLNAGVWTVNRSEEHKSELQSRQYLVCRL